MISTFQLIRPIGLTDAPKTQKECVSDACLGCRLTTRPVSILANSLVLISFFLCALAAWRLCVKTQGRMTIHAIGLMQSRTIEGELRASRSFVRPGFQSTPLARGELSGYLGAEAGAGLLALPVALRVCLPFFWAVAVLARTFLAVALA